MRILANFSLATLFLLFFSTIAYAQEVKVNLGVDLKNPEIKEVIDLWTSYIQSRPSKSTNTNNQFWADSENSKYKDVDLLLYSYSGFQTTYELGTPTIYYVKPTADGYHIKTMFQGKVGENDRDILAMTSVYARKEDGSFKLFNALTVNGKQWQKRKIDHVTFYYPPNHDFDEGKAADLLESIHKLRKDWNLKPIETTYYFAPTYEEIAALRGLDFGLGMGNAQKPTGIVDMANNTVYCAGLGENYFHEVAHVYLNQEFPHSPFLEGLAVFYGGSMGKSLQWHLERMDAYLAENKVDLGNYEKFYYMDNYTNPRGTIEACFATWLMRMAV